MKIKQIDITPSTDIIEISGAPDTPAIATSSFRARNAADGRGELYININGQKAKLYFDKPLTKLFIKAVNGANHHRYQIKKDVTLWDSSVSPELDT